MCYWKEASSFTWKCLHESLSHMVLKVGNESADYFILFSRIQLTTVKNALL